MTVIFVKCIPFRMKYNVKSSGNKRDVGGLDILTMS